MTISKLKLSPRPVVLFGRYVVERILIIMYCMSPVICDIQYSIKEEEPVSTFVANVLQDAQLDVKYNIEDIDKLEFSLSDRRGSKQGYSDLFHIDAKSAVLRTAQIINRDKICAHLSTCVIPLNVIVQPGQYFQIIKVTVNIEDINDHRPIFPESDLTMSISENSLVGFKFALASAEDDDSGKYGVQQYHLVSSSDKFGLVVTNSTFGTMDINLIVKEKLDREMNEQYLMEVVAVDGGIPPKSGVMRLHITLIDANDNNPTFENYTYEKTLAENFPPGRTILKLEAHDPDAGANGQIFYRLADNTMQNYGHIFGIDAHTGELYLKTPLDFEKVQSYSLTVMARDQGLNSLPAYSKVILRVEDVNDHAPEIKINSLTNSGNVEVSEEAPIGTFVAHVSVMDRDAGQSGQVHCEMKSKEFELEQLYEEEFKMISTSLFDRERKHEYKLQLECRDNGSPVQRTIKHITVSVNDTNDNKPVFSQQVYSEKIRENNAIGAFILQVNASDADAGRNRLLSFSIPGGTDQGMVSIDAGTGVIRAHGSFDYEKEHIYEFPIIAKDRGIPVRTGSAILRINVIDINDEAPQFVRNSYNFEIKENQPAYTSIGRVVATDQDANPYNIIKYSIDTFYEGYEFFHIDEDTGEISSIAILDREHLDVYHLVIVATNAGYPQMRTSINTSIFVLDENDNSPEIDFPSDSNNMVHIANDLAIGSIISRIQAFDSDEGDNAILQYMCTAGNEEAYFILNQTTGILTLNRNLATFDYYHFTLSIKVEDGGSPMKGLNTDLHIIVNRSLAVLHFADSSGFSFLHIENHHLIVGTVVIIMLVLILVVVIIILRCKQRQHVQANKYNCRREAKKRDTSRIESNPEWKPLPTYAIHATNTSEKPRKNVKFNMEKPDGNAKEQCDHLWPEHQSSHFHKKQMHEMLQLLPQDHDSESGSYTDSGRGPSEEGENSHPPNEGQIPNSVKTNAADNNTRPMVNGQEANWLKDNRPPEPNLKSFSTLQPSNEIRYQNRLSCSQQLDNRPVLKYSTFHRNCPTQQQSTVDPIWLPRQNESPPRNQALCRSRGPLNNNNNNNDHHHNQLSSSNSSVQNLEPFSRVGVSPSCETSSLNGAFLINSSLPPKTSPVPDTSFETGQQSVPRDSTHSTLIV